MEHEQTTIIPKTRPRGRPKKLTPERVLNLTFKPTVYALVRAVADGAAREIACFGPRGDGKTVGVLGAMLAHAERHQRASFPLPVPWIGVTDTFAAHKLKTKRTLLDPLWRGTWQLSDGDHVATALVNGQPVVRLDLFGIEDQGAMDRVRMETVGVWFEEPAPAALMVQSSGISDMAWNIALTSQRVASHCHPAIMSLNYPDEDHWTWKRFLPVIRSSASAPTTGTHPEDASRRWFQIPPGERASPAQRAEWAHALRERPDLLRRLIEGLPGTVLMGPQVAEGFREDLHVARERLRPIEGEPLFLGQDFGHTPATIIGQPWRGFLRILAALPCEHGGVRQHAETSVLPWLARHAPWTLQAARALLRGCYDPAGQTGEESDIEKNPVDTLERLVGGLWWPGPIAWEARKHCLLSALNRHAEPGRLALQIDPVEGAPLIKALSGRWHYPMDRLGAVRRDLPKKPNHPWEDLGDALIYLLWGMMGEEQPPPGPLVVESSFALRMPTLMGAR
jgi:hypothetical protein